MAIKPLRLGNNVYPKLAFIGAGNMAGAIIAGLTIKGYPKEAICVSAPSLNNRALLSETYGILHMQDNHKNAEEAHAIILAVKPQMMASVCLALKQAVNLKNKLIITLAAGIEINQYKTWLGEETQIIRVMPNTPALIGEGMTGIYCPKDVASGAYLFVEQLMLSIGQVFRLTEESQMHAFVATAGSSPAYFFIFMQAMQKAAVELGLTPDDAKNLVLQSAKGAVLLANEMSDLSFDTLAKQVTSKGGTTEQAVNVFEKREMNEIVALAMTAADMKSRTMSTSQV